VALFAVANPHQDRNILEPLFNKYQVVAQPDCLRAGEWLEIISGGGHGADYIAVARGSIQLAAVM
jgi:hypothetical protein